MGMVTEVCPVCQVRFVAASRVNRYGESKVKVCPAGHETPVGKLRAYRKEIGLRVKPAPREAVEVSDQLPLLSRQQAMDLLGSMVAAYEQAMRTLPAGSLGAAIVAGAFDNTVAISRKALGIA